MLMNLQKINSLLDESNKSCAVGASEENRNKNRCDSVIPFDRNRVILTPIGESNIFTQNLHPLFVSIIEMQYVKLYLFVS